MFPVSGKSEVIHGVHVSGRGPVVDRESDVGGRGSCGCGEADQVEDFQFVGGDEFAVLSGVGEAEDGGGGDGRGRCEGQSLAVDGDQGAEKSKNEVFFHA